MGVAAPGRYSTNGIGTVSAATATMATAADVRLLASRPAGRGAVRCGPVGAAPSSSSPPGAACGACGRRLRRRSPSAPVTRNTPTAAVAIAATTSVPRMIRRRLTTTSVIPSAIPSTLVTSVARRRSCSTRHSTACSRRPPSSGAAGSRLKAASPRFNQPMSPASSPTAAAASPAGSRSAPVATSPAPAAITMLIHGPVAATANSSRGVRPWPDSSVAPPSANRVMPPTCSPRRRAATACPSSCARTDRMRMTLPMTARPSATDVGKRRPSRPVSTHARSAPSRTNDGSRRMSTPPRVTTRTARRNMRGTVPACRLSPGS